MLSNIHNLSRPERPENANLGGAPAREPLASVVFEYAPFIYHATGRSRPRQDLISNIDFDGDFVGNNNWENFERFRIKPTVYYAALETETHYFISYHLFHPRDWNNFTFWVNDTHENDGENFQVVVRKSDGRVVMLWTQAHYDSWVYANPGSGIESGETEIEAGLQVLNSDGAPDGAGRHAAVFVQSQGHGIYGTMDSASGVTIQPDGSYSFDGRSGVLYKPARDGEVVDEPEQPGTGEILYQLDSITLKLWPRLRDGSLTGDGRLLDGSYPYQDELVQIAEVPRFYDSDRFSGPLGSDRGISPFALDFSFNRGTLGALFFNPAKRYGERLKIAEPWSREYVNYPFAK
jgi:hypothetical protein